MNSDKCKVGIVFGGSDCLRQDALISARYLYELLMEMPNYSPELLFFDVGATQAFYKIPVHLLYKESLDDIRDNIFQWEKTDTPNISGGDLPVRMPKSQLSSLVDFIWIALKQRPGNDGQLQMTLEGLSLPYNSADIAVMNSLHDKVGINKFLKDNEFSVAALVEVQKEAYEAQVVAVVKAIEGKLAYPLVPEVQEEYCVMTEVAIKDRKHLLEWLDIVFRDSYTISEKEKQKWQIGTKPEADVFILREKNIKSEGVYSSPFIAGIYTEQLADGLIAYELSALMVPQKDGLSPLIIKEELDESDVLSQVNIELERLARVIDMRGFGLIEGVLTVAENGKAELIIKRVDGMPIVSKKSPFAQLVWQNGETSDAVIDKIITFGIQRAANKKVPAQKMVVMESEKTDEIEEIPTVSTPVEPMAITQSSADKSEKGQVGEKSFWASLWAFFKSKTFLKNLGGIIGFLLLGFILLNGWMRSYTRHNDFIVVNDYVGLNVEDGIEKAKSQGLEMIVLERHFEAGATPDEIYQQTPKADAQIKKGRKIYVNIYTDSQLEFELPSIIGNDNYELYTRGLRKHPYQLKTVIRKKQFNAKLEDNTILFLYYNDKKITPSELKKGVKVLQGSTIEFVVSTRYSNYSYVPDIVCQKFDAAKFMLNNYDLEVGEVVGGETGFVVRQEPAAGKRLEKGAKVKIFTAAHRSDKCKY